MTSSKFFRSLIILLTFALAACQTTTWYKKEIPVEKYHELAKQMGEGAAGYYQGSAPNMLLLKEGIKMDSTIPDLWRELATPYLKRGMPHQAFQYYKKEIELAPELWQGWRGYLYLYFYRDYERAIADFNATDTLTEITDYPQGQSVDYMRGLCYYGLKDYNTALKFFSRYINEVSNERGESWVDTYAFLYRALTHEKLGRPGLAIDDLDTGLKYDPRLSDFHFHKARIATDHSLADRNEILQWCSVAEQRFKEGYFHHRDYIEVHDQIYLSDLHNLEARIARSPH